MAHAKRGKRIERNGVIFKSKWEANVGLVLDHLVDKGVLVSWQYEPTTYYFNEWCKTGAVNYKPDFLIEWADRTKSYIEVKGYAVSDDRTKIRRYRKYYNTYPIILVTDHADMISFAEAEGIEVWSYREMTKKYKPMLDGWV